MSDDIVARLRRIYSGGYWALMGLELLEAEPGWGRMRLVARDDHLNTNDVVHGGVISALVDTTAGAAVRALRDDAEIRERPHATSDLHVSYLSAATGGELIAEATVVKAGRTLIFIEVNVTDERERKVARGLATMVITARPPKPREEAEQTGE